MIHLKPISSEAIPVAMSKAERYRLLNEPREAESICRDVLDIEPDNQDALVTLLLALTDQFDASSGGGLEEARHVLHDVRGEYEQAYYGGIISERWGKAQFAKGMPPHVLGDWLRQAMMSYERAEALRPSGNDDAILRWNACVRMMRRELESGFEPEPQPAEDGLDDEVPTL